jgi:hypothetical protein
MPILFLIVGLVLLVLCLTYFQKGASIDAQKIFWRLILFVIIPAALFYLLLLGRIVPALLVMFVVSPFIVSEIKSLRKVGAEDVIEGEVKDMGEIEEDKET